MLDLVRSKTGVPDSEDFRAKDGTPLVVDRTTTTGKIYFLDDGENVREAGDSLTTCTVSALTATTATVSALTAVTAKVSGPLDLSATVAGQIAFPASQNASANANTLDDYEEGSTNPTPTPGSGSFTSATATTSYTKVGNLVRVRAAVVITTNGTAAAYVSIPMPFTAAETTAIAGTENAGAFALCGYVTGANMLVYKYDGTYPGADGRTLQMSCTFKV